jgi:hypothetical protein
MERGEKTTGKGIWRDEGKENLVVGRLCRSGGPLYPFLAVGNYEEMGTPLHPSAVDLAPELAKTEDSDDNVLEEAPDQKLKDVLEEPPVKPQRPKVEFTSPRAFFQSLGRRIASIFTKRFCLALLVSVSPLIACPGDPNETPQAGQFVSIWAVYMST